MKKLIPVALSGAVIFLFSCHSLTRKSIGVKPEEKVENIVGIAQDSFFQGEPDRGDKQQEEKRQPDKGSSVSSSQDNRNWDKKIIKTGTLNLEVKDFKEFDSYIRSQVTLLGGYIASEEQQEYFNRVENRVILKIPVNRFEEALGILSTGILRLNERKVSSSDVTGAIVDTKSRLEAKRQVRQRYLELLGKARNMEEILQVQNEINQIQEEMELAAGRISSLSHAASYSTIELTYYQVLNGGKEDPENPGFGEKIMLGLKNGASWLGDLFIVIANLWPLWLAIGGVLVWIGKRRNRFKNQPVFNQPEPDKKFNG